MSVSVVSQKPGETKEENPKDDRAGPGLRGIRDGAEDALDDSHARAILDRRSSQWRLARSAHHATAHGPLRHGQLACQPLITCRKPGQPVSQLHLCSRPRWALTKSDRR